MLKIFLLLRGLLTSHVAWSTLGAEFEDNVVMSNHFLLAADPCGGW